MFAFYLFNTLPLFINTHRDEYILSIHWVQSCAITSDFHLLQFFNSE